MPAACIRMFGGCRPEVWVAFVECGGHRSAEIGIGQQSGNLGFPLCLCRRDEASYLLIGRDAKWPNTWLGLRCVIGERQNWYSRAPGDRSD